MLETRRVNGLFGEADLFSLWTLEARRVYSRLDTDFFAVAWLELGPVFTLGDIDLSTFVTTTLRTFDVYSCVVVVSVGELEVDVGFGVLGMCWSVKRRC